MCRISRRPSPEVLGGAGGLSAMARQRWDDRAGEEHHEDAGGQAGEPVMPVYKGGVAGREVRHEYDAGERVVARVPISFGMDLTMGMIKSLYYHPK